ncbi:MAG: hypothetical protein LIO86_12010 [Lachnospiraceae bacterium]|nr:hypothetical protein [Lachnospiraceae bacterium]
MRVTDRLIEDAKKRARKPEPEDEEMDEYMERRRQPYLNEKKAVFDDDTFGGFNTQKSVFDRTAIFRTGERDDGK